MLIDLLRIRSSSRRAPARRRLAPAALICAALAVSAAPATAHQLLLHASPAADTLLDRVPTELRLRFSEPVDLHVTRIQLLGPAGPVPLGDLRLATDSPTVLVVPVAGPVLAGDHTVTWRTVGMDGHPVSGQYEFGVAEGAEGAAAPSVEPIVPPPVEAAEPALRVEAPPYVAIRWLNLGGLLLLLGAIAYRVFVLGTLGRFGVSAAGRLVSLQERRVAGVGAAAAVMLVVAAVLRLGAQALAVFGPDALESTELVFHLLAAGPWAAGWWIQVAAAPIGLAGFIAARRGRRAGWAVAAVAALPLAATPGLSGHAAITGALAPVTIFADTVHVIGAGGWLGSVLLLATIGLGAALRFERDDRGAAAAGMLTTFSPVALTFAALAAGSGILLAWVHVGTVPMLWRSAYGLTLLLKLALLAIVAVIGAFNWLWLKPSLRDPAEVRRLRRSAAVESAMGAVVILITAALVALPRPVDMARIDESEHRHPEAGQPATSDD